jgi:acetolactate synthase-1/2/3 large subunit
MHTPAAEGSSLRPPGLVAGEATLVAPLIQGYQHGSVASKPLMNGAQVLVKLLEQHGVNHVFGIPGAKVDSVFEALLDSSIELVLCRHEQNAAFMAQATGRITGKVGVCLATSGPGVTNLVTGLITATTEGDPVLAIGGEVPLDDRFKHTHQSLDGVDVMRPVTKYAQSALNIHCLPEVFANAVRAAESGRP